MQSSIGLQRGDYVYYARVVDFDCLPLIVHNVNEDLEYFTAIERAKNHKSGVTYLFNFSDYNKIVYKDLYDAKDYLEIERDKSDVSEFREDD